MKQNAIKLLDLAYSEYAKGKVLKALSAFLLFENLFPEFKWLITKNKEIIQVEIENLENKINDFLYISIPVYNNLLYLIECFYKINSILKDDHLVEYYNSKYDNFLVVKVNLEKYNIFNNKNYSQKLKAFLEINNFFDCNFYIRQYQKIVDIENPLDHFINFGFYNNFLPANWLDFSTECEKVENEVSFKPDSNPKVSIIVPVFNNHEYLSECLDSILYQTLRDIEIIIINDGSTDEKTINLLNQYKHIDDRIKLINKKNTGYGHSMNVGLINARGKYIGIVESDDYIDKNMYEILYKKIEKNECDLIRTNFKRFMGEKNNRQFELHKIDHTEKYYDKIIDPQKTPEVIKIYNTIWNGIYKREFLLKNNIKFNESPGASFQDNGFHFQTIMAARKIMLLKEATYMLRRDNPTSSIHSKQKIFAVFYEYKFIEDILKKNKDLYKIFGPYFYYKKFGNFIFHLERIDESYKEKLKKIIYNEFIIHLNKNEIRRSIFGEKNYKALTDLIAYKGKKEDQKNFVFITDKSYYIPTIVSVSSLIKNAKEENKYCLNIIYTDLDNSQIESLKNLENDNIKLKLYCCKNYFENNKIKHEITNKKVTKTALIKFNIQNILPYDKALYIDGDTLVLKDLKDIFTLDINNYYCAAGRDIPWGLYEKKKIKNIEFKSDYLNSGVMLLNLKRLRNENIAEKLFETKSWLTTSLMDQDAFNYTFYKKVLFLPLEYNCMADSIYRHLLKNKISINFINKKIHTTYESFDDMLQNIKILHFGSYYKPWEYYDMLFADIWKEYYDNSVLKNIKLYRVSRQAEFNKKLSLAQ